MVEESKRGWWLLILRGICAVLFGILAFIWPGITLASLVLLFGAYALANGVLAIVMASKAPKGSPGKAATVVLGLLSIGAAVVTVLAPGITALSLVFVIAAWAIVTGALEVAAAVALRKFMDGTWVLVISGVLSDLRSPAPLDAGRGSDLAGLADRRVRARLRSALARLGHSFQERAGRYSGPGRDLGDSSGMYGWREGAPGGGR